MTATTAPPLEDAFRVRVPAPFTESVKTRLVVRCDRHGCARESAAFYVLPRSMSLADRYALHRDRLARFRGWTRNDLGDDMCPVHGQTPAPAPVEVTL
ncbi:hypothetical protein SUDANB1_05603 [Streptomyces sp. enrichment culture]|uniref:hypothetical protein n=1 Tax=Streptomyces sp. enrichment culture TaxID=1795815 RepID=UPI003F578CD4